MSALTGLCVTGGSKLSRCKRLGRVDNMCVSSHEILRAGAQLCRPCVIGASASPGDGFWIMSCVWLERCCGTRALTVRASVCTQSAVADRNVSETVYMAESLYLRYDIPFIMQPILQALTRRGLNVSTINSTHVLFHGALRGSSVVTSTRTFHAVVHAASPLRRAADPVKVIIIQANHIT